MGHVWWLTPEAGLTGEDFTCGHVTHWKQRFDGRLCLQLCSPLVVNNSFSWSVHLLLKARGWPEIGMFLGIHNISTCVRIYLGFFPAWSINGKVLPWVHYQVLNKGWLPSQAGSSQYRPVSIDTSASSCLSQHNIFMTITTCYFLIICTPW